MDKETAFLKEQPLSLTIGLQGRARQWEQSHEHKHVFIVDATIRCFLPSVPSLSPCTHAQTHLLTHPCQWKHDLKFLCPSTPKLCQKHWVPQRSSLFYLFFLLVLMISGNQKLRARWINYPKPGETFQDGIWLQMGISRPYSCPWGSYLAPRCHNNCV